MGRCCVKKCKEQGTHRIPSGNETRKAWLDPLSHRKMALPDRARICSKHFREEDFVGEGFQSGIPLERKRLKNTAVPSLFLKPETAKERREPQIVAQSSSNIIPLVSVPAKDPLHIEDPKVMVKIETEVKIEMDMEQTATVCRTCLTENAITPLTDMCDEGCTLGDMLEDITGVRMDAGLPDNICVVCTGDLQLAIAFRRRAQNADKTLRQQTGITSGGDSIFPSYNVKSEFPSGDTNDPNSPNIDATEVNVFNNVHDHTYNSSNIVSSEEINVYRSRHDHSYTAAPIKNNESDVDWEPNKKTVKRPRGRPKKKQTIAKAANVRGQLLQNKATYKNQIPLSQLKKGIKISTKKPVQQVLKLKAIDKNQIPLAQLKKIRMIKLKPTATHQKGPVQAILNPSNISAGTSLVEAVNPSNKVSAGTSGTAKSVTKPIYKPPTKWQKVIVQEPVRNTVKSFKLLTNEPETSQDDTQQGNFTCQHKGCGRTFTTPKLLMHHKYASHLPDNRLFLCLTCGKKSDTRQQALNHLKVHKIDNKKATQMNCRIQCELCGIFFRVESQLERHIRRTHEGERKHKCTECDRRFFLHNAMVMHRRNHNVPTEGCETGDKNSDSSQDAHAKSHESMQF